MQPVNLISGLGVDRRGFRNMNFPDFRENHIEWIAPRQNEAISRYASRLLPQVQGSPPVLIGLSFGGMIAVEMSKLIPTEKVILLASASTRFELPPHFRLAGKYGLNRLFPMKLFKYHTPLTNWLFGVETRADERILKEIIRDTDLHFLQWAINAILTWENEYRPSNLIHIHGARDRILPLGNTSCDFVLESAGHLMTLNRAVELSGIIQEILKGKPLRKMDN